MKTWMTILTMTAVAVLLLTACGGDAVPADSADTAATTTTAALSDTAATTPTNPPTLATVAPEDLPVVDGNQMETMDNGDGTFTRFTYDEQGLIIRTELLDGSDLVLEETLFDRDYDENGKLIRETVITDAIKVSESIYAYSTEAAGETYLSQGVMYYADGSKEVTTYQEGCYDYKTVYYGTDGEAANAEEYFYEGDEMVARITYMGEDTVVTKEEYGYDENGNQITTTLDPEGNVITKQKYEYDDTGMTVTVYDADGNELSCERMEYEFAG